MQSLEAIEAGDKIDQQANGKHDAPPAPPRKAGRPRKPKTVPVENTMESDIEAIKAIIKRRGVDFVGIVTLAVGK